MLDNIESNLAEANDYIEKAEQNLISAQTMHQQNRSKCFWIFLGLVLAGAILACWLLGVF